MPSQKKRCFQEKNLVFRFLHQIFLLFKNKFAEKVDSYLKYPYYCLVFIGLCKRAEFRFADRDSNQVVRNSIYR